MTHTEFLQAAIDELGKQYSEVAHAFTDQMKRALEVDDWRPVQWARQWRSMLDYQLAVVEYALDDGGIGGRMKEAPIVDLANERGVTPAQVVIEAITEHGSLNKAAKALGVSRQALTNHLNKSGLRTVTEQTATVRIMPITPAVGDRIFVKEYEALKYFVPPNGVLVNPIRQTTGGYHSTVVQVLAEEIGEDELGKPVYSVSIIDATGREHPVEHVQLLYGK